MVLLSSTVAASWLTAPMMAPAQSPSDASCLGSSYWAQSPTAAVMELPRDARMPTASSEVIGHLPSPHFALSFSIPFATLKIPLMLPLTSAVHLPSWVDPPRTSPSNGALATWAHLSAMISLASARPAVAEIMLLAARPQAALSPKWTLPHALMVPAIEDAR